MVAAATLPSIAGVAILEDFRVVVGTAAPVIGLAAVMAQIQIREAASWAPAGVTKLD